MMQTLHGRCVHLSTKFINHAVETYIRHSLFKDHTSVTPELFVTYSYHIGYPDKSYVLKFMTFVDKIETNSYIH